MIDVFLDPTDSPEVAAKRLEVDERLQHYSRLGVNLDLKFIRLMAYLQYLATKLGDRNEAEMLFLKTIELECAKIDEALPRATLLAPGR